MSSEARVIVSGMGSVCALGVGVPSLRRGLEATQSGVVTSSTGEWAVAPASDFEPGCWIAEAGEGLPIGGSRLQRLLQQGTRSSQLSVAAASEAWKGAGLRHVDPDSITLVVGGNNLSADLPETTRRRREQTGWVSARYPIQSLDSHQVGILAELFGIRGPGWTTGAASASGMAALFQGWQLVRSGVTPVCIVVGAATTPSQLELEGFATLGAMASLDAGENPRSVCRPFDLGHRGFVWGEGSACLVLEREDHATCRGVAPLGSIAGASLLMSPNSGPEPSLEAEKRAMNAALRAAGLTTDAVGYVNAHGTGTPEGDDVEAEAIGSVFGVGQPWVNATKALVGHTLSAAGVLEAVATLVQLNGRFLHGNPNLDASPNRRLNLVGPRSKALDCRHGLSNGFGFGGFNGSLVLERAD